MTTGPTWMSLDEPLAHRARPVAVAANVGGKQKGLWLSTMKVAMPDRRRAGEHLDAGRLHDPPPPAAAIGPTSGGDTYPGDKPLRWGQVLDATTNTMTPWGSPAG